MKEPEISAIVCTFNEAKYIGPCLASLKKQIFGDFEIIVSDGNSGDSTLDIAKKFTNRIVSSKDKNIASGRNKGARLARGKIIGFIDADCLVGPNLLNKVRDAFRNSKDCVGVATKFFPRSNSPIDKLLVCAYGKFVSASLHLKPQVPAMCCFYRKDIFWKCGGLDDRMTLNEDVDLSSRAGELGRIVLLDEYVQISMRRVRKYGYLRFILFHTASFWRYNVAKDVLSVKYPPVR